MNHTIRFVAVCIAAVLTACAGQDEFPTHTHEEFSAATSLVAQTCSSLNTRGQPVRGTFCGGSTHAFNCTPGAMYNCNDKTASGNCTLVTACANGCIAADFAGDACFTGTPSFVVPATTIPGGSEATATVKVAAHTNDAIVNVRTIRPDLLAARFDCNIPHMPPAVSSATFNMPTAVVAAPTPVDVYTDISYLDPQGQSHEVVSRTVTVNLQPGGTPPPAPAVTSFTLTPSTIAAGAVTFVNATLDHMAPVNGQAVNITSSDPATASVIPNGQPLVLGGCTVGGGAETLQAAKQVTATTDVTVSAASAGSAQVPATNTLTVQSGCSPLTCVDLPMPFCQASDGCGGTLSCGCSFGEVCGGGGPGICGSGAPPPPTTGTPTLTGLTLSPSSTTAGSAVTGTITLSAAAPASGVVVGLSSSSAAATVPPTVTVGAGFTSASFTITTGSVTSATTATITGTLGSSQAATLSIAPAATPAAGTLTVTATGRSGVTITSNPAGISVPVGQVGTGSFASGTTITLSASSGRTVIWSGACASSRDVNSCTFTLTGNASVTANVK